MILIKAPIHEMGEKELGDHNREARLHHWPEARVGFTAIVTCRHAGETEQFSLVIVEELLQSPLSFLGELTKACETKWGVGMLDADLTEFLWLPLKLNELMPNTIRSF